MNRKTVPMLVVSIAVSVLAVALVIILQRRTPDRSEINDIQRNAVHTLLARRTGLMDEDQKNLNAIAHTLAKPLEAGGSIDNLNHYLSKDLGRIDFPRPMDRRRAGSYLDAAMSNKAEFYSSQFHGAQAPIWAAMYTGIVKALFDEVKRDVLTLAGIPQGITTLSVPISDKQSCWEQVEQAVDAFAQNWIPPGETRFSYTPEREAVRQYLTRSRAFSNRMEKLDTIWRNLAAALYNLSMNPQWQTAEKFRPELHTELDELIVLVLTASIHYRGLDVMNLVADTVRAPGSPVSPGIMWSPEFSIYKNIPEVSGRTADEVTTLFFAKVNLGYAFMDTRTQTWLNRRRDWLTDYFNSFFSSTLAEDFSPPDMGDAGLFAWKSTRLKALAIHQINRSIVSDMPFGAKGVYGVRDIAFVRANFLVNP